MIYKNGKWYEGDCNTCKCWWCDEDQKERCFIVGCTSYEPNEDAVPVEY